MSAFDTAALPGRMPTAGSGADQVSPEHLFRSRHEKSLYEELLKGVPGSSFDFRVKKVKVEIFDLSDADQRKKYEKLYSELLVKSSKNEVVVETRKDLVHRPDGTSYWMKYVEYVEFGNSSKKK